jgi:hypothetical protein
MASSVRSRPNHYEVLGLSPTASPEEINSAFAKGMGMFGARGVAAAADIGLAFAILRDPVKRRAYDRALGLVREPEPARWTNAAPELGGTGFISWGSTATAHPTVLDYKPSSLGEAARGHEPEPPAEPGLASIIASLRELAKKETRAATPEIKHQRAQQPPAEKVLEPKVEPRPEPQIEQLLAAHLAEKESVRQAEHRPVGWRRAALVVGGIVAVAGLVGALGGLSVRDAEQSQRAEPAVTVRLPSVDPRPSASVPSPEKAGEGIVFQPAHFVGSEPVAGRMRRASPPKRPAPPVQPQVDQSATLASAPDENAPKVATSDPLAIGTPAAQPVAASLPLPNNVIARTIERIGYACGEVSSTAAVEDAPGTFKIICSSGHAYQAKPVRGRYRFRRWAQ